LTSEAYLNKLGFDPVTLKKKNMFSDLSVGRSRLPVRVFACLIALCSILTVDSAGQESGKKVYDQINAFTLSGGKADVTNLVLKRDRVVMTFTGTFYFSAPVAGRITGAVFIGRGTFHADVPPSTFERENVKRLLNADAVDSEFSSAALRFSDDTFQTIGANHSEGSATPAAQSIASDVDTRIRKETGANLPARLAVSILNDESPGVFFAHFDGGEHGRFSYIFDPQNRIPTQDFEINGGEKGLIFSYKGSIYSNDIWMAFFGLADYARQNVHYSDVFDLVDVNSYDMEIDLRNPKARMGLRSKTQMKSLLEGLNAIPFTIGGGLGQEDAERLKKQLRLKSVTLNGATIDAVQEDWESGFTVFLPKPAHAFDQIELDFELEGDFMFTSEYLDACYYPRSNDTWFPRHGYLDRATFDLKFIHQKRFKIASGGIRLSEEPSPEDKEIFITKYKMSQPVPELTFALGPWERHDDTIKWENGDKPTPLEFNSVPGRYAQIKESFLLAELSNTVRYFQQLFGPYPYENFSATFHPFAFGQGFPSMMMIFPADDANKYTYRFLSHETSHQWWGNAVAWRSYRDQWLSEGFAEYSGVLYTARRENAKAASNLIDEMRKSLKDPPYTRNGKGEGKLNDVGPIILGHRLESSKTFGAYNTLIYNKGALVLRMLHYLLTDQYSGSDAEFFNMMRDFVTRYRNKSASTDDFRNVAAEHFLKMPVSQEYQLRDLDWFFNEWVYRSALPSYKVTYTTKNNADGSVMLDGTVIQENVTEDWFMPLPLAIFFGNGQWSNTTIPAVGTSSQFHLKLPRKPVDVQLDPFHWILSDKSEIKEQH
jgi:hypothetical protein